MNYVHSSRMQLKAFLIALLSPPGLGPSTVVSEIVGTILAAMHKQGVLRFVRVSAHPLVATRPPVLVPLVKWIFRNPFQMSLVSIMLSTPDSL